MDFLYKTFEQLRDLWKSMTPSARLASGLMAGVIIVSALWLVRGTPEKSDHSLFGGREFPQSEIAKMEQAFAKANLSGSEVVGNRIHVPSAMKHKYLAALAEAGVVPDSPYSDIEEAGTKDNPFTSQKTRENSISVAKQKALAKTIASFKDIESAFVIYDETMGSGFPRGRNASALVTVHTKTNNPLDESTVRAIRSLMVAAYSGLKAEKVSIADAKANRTYDGPPADGAPGASQGIYMEAKSRYDQEYEAKIRRALSMYPGIQVSASTTLSPDLLHQKRTMTIDPKTVPLSTKETTEERQNTTSGPSGVPGAASNGVNINSQAVAVGSKGDTSKETLATSESQNVASRTEMVEAKAPLIPTTVNASISVPASYYLNLWNVKNPPVAGQPAKTPTIEDLKAIETPIKKDIEGIVEKHLPPVPDGGQSYPRIQVTTFQDLPAPPAEAPSVFDWLMPILLANWQAAGLGILGLVGVVMLRSMMKSAQPGEAPAPIADEEDEPKVDEPPPPGVISQLRERFGSTGPTLREELQLLVKEDPEAAASVLKNWIGEAA